MKGTLKQRLCAKIALPTSPDGCLLWTAAIDSSGYGTFKVIHAAFGCADLQAMRGNASTKYQGEKAVGNATTN